MSSCIEMDQLYRITSLLQVFVEGYETGSPDEQLNPKKKVWEKLSVDLKTSSACVAQWQGNNLLTSKGIVTCKKISGAPIK